MSCSQSDANATLDTIKVMRRQEETCYHVSDYLSKLPAGAIHEAPVDEGCRHLMAKWCNDISDFCKYSRETVAVTMSCLDRFMATPAGRKILLDRGEFQLATMTALYTAVKIHEHEALNPELVSSLSRGAHSPEAVEEMERRMLNAIQWRTNPPTASSFARYIVDLVPENLMDTYEREAVLELSKYQVDLAMSEYKFCRASASRVAFASLLNAVESVTSDGMFFSNFESTFSDALDINASSLQDLRISLYEIVDGEKLATTIISKKQSESKNMGIYSSSGEYRTSPRAVNST